MLPTAQKCASHNPKTSIRYSESSVTSGLLEHEGDWGETKRHARMGNEGGLGRVPSEGADAEL